jgi:hypothetical protein
MKDIIGREVQVGNYIAYALTAGRSANLGIYQVKEVLEDKIKASKINESYSWSLTNFKLEDGKVVPWKYIKWSPKLGKHTEMTTEEKFKIDNKTSTLSMPERIFILDNFTPEVLQGETN